MRYLALGTATADVIDAGCCGASDFGIDRSAEVADWIGMGAVYLGVSSMCPSSICAGVVDVKMMSWR